MTTADIFSFACSLGVRNTEETSHEASYKLQELCVKEGLAVMREDFVPQPWNGRVYTNLVVGDLATAKAVLTAHYDTIMADNKAACDNNSGVAVLLSTLFQAKGQLAGVLTACEEPPFFAHKMGAEEFTRVHPNLKVPLLALDSLGWNGDGHQHQLILHAPTTGCPWAANLALKTNAVLTINDSVRMLSEVRQTHIPMVLVLDNATLFVPFHTSRDTPDKVSVDWLDRVATQLAVHLPALT